MHLNEILRHRPRRWLWPAAFALAQTSSDPGSTDIRQDLARYDSKFGLPRARLHVVTAVAKSATPYLSNVEELGDTEMVHAFAPGATLDIILVPASTIASSANVAAAVTKAVRESAALHVAVLGVGGTILDARPDGAYLGEMAWNDPTEAEASGGGYSSLFARPPYQDGLAGARATRGVPDVSANADPATAMATDNSYGQLRADSGTSSSTPLWAGVIALADQQAGQHLGFVNPALYAIARSPAYHRAFHDVVTGDNSILWPTGVFTGYNAGPGWDPVTGLGSPDAQYLVPLLARTGRPGA